MQQRLYETLRCSVLRFVRSSVEKTSIPKNSSRDYGTVRMITPVTSSVQ